MKNNLAKRSHDHCNGAYISTNIMVRVEPIFAATPPLQKPG